MDVYIITGSSRGLGEALAERLLLENNRVVGVSRTSNERLAELAGSVPGRFDFVPFDLGRADGHYECMEGIIDSVRMETNAGGQLTLIHNAGVLGPIAQLSLADEAELARNVQVNLTAPLLMTSAFLRLTEELRERTVRTIVNISSGAAKKPYIGWSAYCAAKAGMDMLTRCVAAEQGEGAHAARIVSIAPGVVDTAMQEQIRGTDEARFPSKPRFVELKRTGKLFSPQEAADKLIRVVRNGDWKQGDILDLRDL